MNWRERHKLLVAMLSAPYSDFRASDDDREYYWIKGSANYGTTVLVFSEDGTAKKAGLHVDGQRVCGASRLFRYLNNLKSGMWTDGMLQRLRRQMRNLRLGEWTYKEGTDGPQSRDSVIVAIVDRDRVVLHDCGMLFVNDLRVAVYEKALWNAFTTYGPKLHRDLLRSPLSSWEEQKFPISKTSWKFWRTVPGFGRIIVHSTWGTAKEAKLTIEGKCVADGSELFRYLTGQWSWNQKRRLTRRLKGFDGEGWQLHGALSEHGAYLSRELDGDMVKVYESGTVNVHNVTVMTAPRLYQNLYHQAICCDYEHRDDY